MRAFGGRSLIALAAFTTGAFAQAAASHRLYLSPDTEAVVISTDANAPAGRARRGPGASSVGGSFHVIALERE